MNGSVNVFSPSVTARPKASRPVGVKNRNSTVGDTLVEPVKCSSSFRPFTGGTLKIAGTSVRGVLRTVPSPSVVPIVTLAVVKVLNPVSVLRGIVRRPLPIDEIDFLL